MIFTELSVKGAWLADMERRSDDRGFFARAWCAAEFAAKGMNPHIAQINVAHSPTPGTLRGIHWQVAPHLEAKTVRCVAGAVFDVVVDLRADSATFCNWYGTELTAENGRVLYLPEGCGHGFLTLVADSTLMYQASVPFAGDSARGARHNDPAFGISWPRPVAVISDADSAWPLFPSRRGGA
jgi:dTDP-4-dehydrorhamnose 3,5-epimerase